LNTRRKLVIAFGAGALAAPFGSYAQQPAKIYRIGLLGATTAAGYVPQVEALRASLRELGYEEGRNIAFEFRWAEGKYDRLPALAAELVRLKVEVIVTHGTPGSRAAKQATTTIPIVMATVGDPVENGFVASLARPGGNITGSANFSAELAAKRLELLKDVLPHLKRVAVLVNPDNLSTKRNLRAMEDTAKALKVMLQTFDVRGSQDFASAFAAMAKQRFDAVAVAQDGLLTANSKVIADIAAKQRLPSVGSSGFAQAGGLLGYEAGGLEQWRRAAYFVDKILKGAKPGDIPVEQPTKFPLILNLKTATMLGVKIPQWVLVRADKVIE